MAIGHSDRQGQDSFSTELKSYKFKDYDGNPVKVNGVYKDSGIGNFPNGDSILDDACIVTELNPNMISVEYENGGRISCNGTEGRGLARKLRPLDENALKRKVKNLRKRANWLESTQGDNQ